VRSVERLPVRKGKVFGVIVVACVIVALAVVVFVGGPVRGCASAVALVVVVWAIFACSSVLMIVGTCIFSAVNCFGRCFVIVGGAAVIGGFVPKRVFVVIFVVGAVALVACGVATIDVTGCVAAVRVVMVVVPFSRRFMGYVWSWRVDSVVVAAFVLVAFVFVACIVVTVGFVAVGMAASVLVVIVMSAVILTTAGVFKCSRIAAFGVACVVIVIIYAAFRSIVVSIAAVWIIVVWVVTVVVGASVIVAGFAVSGIRSFIVASVVGVKVSAAVVVVVFVVISFGGGTVVVSDDCGVHRCGLVVVGRCGRGAGRLERVKQLVGQVIQCCENNWGGFGFIVHRRDCGHGYVLALVSARVGDA